MNSIRPTLSDLEPTSYLPSDTNGTIDGIPGTKTYIDYPQKYKFVDESSGDVREEGVEYIVCGSQRIGFRANEQYKFVSMNLLCRNTVSRGPGKTTTTNSRMFTCVIHPKFRKDMLPSNFEQVTIAAMLSETELKQRLVKYSFFDILMEITSNSQFPLKYLKAVLDDTHYTRICLLFLSLNIDQQIIFLNFIVSLHNNCNFDIADRMKYKSAQLLPITNNKIFLLDATAGTGKTHLLCTMLLSIQYHGLYVAYSHDLCDTVRKLSIIPVRTNCELFISTLQCSFFKYKALWSANHSHYIYDRNTWHSDYEQCGVYADYYFAEITPPSLRHFEYFIHVVVFFNNLYRMTVLIRNSRPPYNNVWVVDEYTVLHDCDLLCLCVYAWFYRIYLLFVGNRNQQNSITHSKQNSRGNFDILNSIVTKSFHMTTVVRQEADPAFRDKLTSIRSIIDRYQETNQAAIDVPMNYYIKYMIYRMFREHFYRSIDLRAFFLCGTHVQLQERILDMLNYLRNSTVPVYPERSAENTTHDTSETTDTDAEVANPAKRRRLETNLEDHTTTQEVCSTQQSPSTDAKTPNTGGKPVYVLQYRENEDYFLSKFMRQQKHCKAGVFIEVPPKPAGLESHKFLDYILIARTFRYIYMRDTNSVLVECVDFDLEAHTVTVRSVENPEIIYTLVPEGISSRICGSEYFKWLSSYSKDSVMPNYTTNLYQYPLRYTAMTFHACQGLTLFMDAIDIHIDAMSVNSLYVGLSRVVSETQLQRFTSNLSHSFLITELMDDGYLYHMTKTSALKHQALILKAASHKTTTARRTAVPEFFQIAFTEVITLSMFNSNRRNTKINVELYRTLINFKEETRHTVQPVICMSNVVCMLQAEFQKCMEATDVTHMIAIYHDYMGRKGLEPYDLTGIRANPSTVKPIIFVHPTDTTTDGKEAEVVQ